jgi:hypothetical protein
MDLLYRPEPAADVEVLRCEIVFLDGAHLLAADASGGVVLDVHIGAESMSEGSKGWIPRDLKLYGADGDWPLGANGVDGVRVEVCEPQDFFRLFALSGPLCLYGHDGKERARLLDSRWHIRGDQSRPDGLPRLEIKPARPVLIAALEPRSRPSPLAR